MLWRCSFSAEIMDGSRRSVVVPGGAAGRRGRCSGISLHPVACRPLWAFLGLCGRSASAWAASVHLSSLGASWRLLCSVVPSSVAASPRVCGRRVDLWSVGGVRWSSAGPLVPVVDLFPASAPMRLLVASWRRVRWCGPSVVRCLWALPGALLRPVAVPSCALYNSRNLSPLPVLLSSFGVLL